MLKKTTIIFSAICLLIITNQTFATDINISSINKAKITENQTIKDETIFKKITPLQLVNNPEKYLNKKIQMIAKFDKFSTIGLDYPPTNKDTKTYISFLVKRENVTDYNIPLSELKLIVKRSYAEKELVKLESSNQIEIYGTVFSTALGDPWVDVEKIIILNQNNEEETTKEIKE